MHPECFLSQTCASCVSCATLSFSWPCPCARGVPGGVWPAVCPAVWGLATPCPAAEATGLVADIAVETAWPRVIWATTCCPPWPERESVFTFQIRCKHTFIFLRAAALYFAESQGECGVLSFPLLLSAGLGYGSPSFQDESDHQLPEPGRIMLGLKHTYIQNDCILLYRIVYSIAHQSVKGKRPVNTKERRLSLPVVGSLVYWAWCWVWQIWAGMECKFVHRSLCWMGWYPTLSAEQHLQRGSERHQHQSHIFIKSLLFTVTNF